MALKNEELEVELFESPGVLRIEYVLRGSWGCAFYFVGAIFLLPLAIGIPKLMAIRWTSEVAWGLAAFVLLIVLMVVGMASDSIGSARVDHGGIQVQGFGSNSGDRDPMSIEEIESIELTTMYHSIPGSDDSVYPGLQAVAGKRRLCLVPRPSPEQAQKLMEAIARARPELRDRIRWESRSGLL